VPRRLLHGALAFLTQFLNTFLRVLHSLFSLDRLGFALSHASVPLGLFGQDFGFVILFVVQGDFGLFELVLGGFISTAANSVPPALTALLTADSVTANCSLGGLPAQPARTRLLPMASAASFRLRRGGNEDLAVRVFMVFNSIGKTPEKLKNPSWVWSRNLQFPGVF
jgi:hypothetical protein